jgi:hypothetical protein
MKNALWGIVLFLAIPTLLTLVSSQALEKAERNSPFGRQFKIADITTSQDLHVVRYRLNPLQGAHREWNPNIPEWLPSSQFRGIPCKGGTVIGARDADEQLYFQVLDRNCTASKPETLTR